MKKAYIHIGTHKTGTTSLQAWLYLNADALKEQYGLYYPIVFSTGDGHHALARTISTEIKKIRAEHDDRQGFDLTNQQIKDELFSADILKNNNDIVLSSETFSLINKEADIKRLTQILKGYDVKIIIYIRHIVERIESGYGERVKGIRSHEHRPIEKVFTDKLIDSKKILSDRRGVIKQWQKVFGATNVIVKPYHKATMVNGDSIADFLAVIDNQKLVKDMSKLDSIARDSANISPSKFRIEILRRLNKYKVINNLSLKDRKDFVNFLANDKSFSDPDMNLIYHSRKFSEDLMTKYKIAETSLAKQYYPKLEKYFTTLPERTYLTDLSDDKRKAIEKLVNKTSRNYRLRYQLRSLFGR